MEANLNKGTFVRRDVLQLMAAVGATGLPAVSTFWPSAVHAAGAPAYNAAARFDLAVSEVELRRNSAGRMLMARIYQPKFPDRSRSARRCLEQKRPLRRRADGSRSGLERLVGRRRRHDGCARSAISSLRAGRQLRRALAEGECRDLER